jgi:hypothetical protein
VQVRLKNRVPMPGRKADTVSRPGLHHLEKGTTAAPDPVLLYELCQVYGLDLIALIKLLKWNRANPLATRAPADTELIAEDGMRVTGEEQYFVERFRTLAPANRREVLQFLDFQLTQKKDAATAARFSVSRRKRATD